MAKTVAVDFDGVIHAYGKGWLDGTIYDEPVPGAFDALRKLMETFAVFIHTTRQPALVGRWIKARSGIETSWGGQPGNLHTVGEFWNQRDCILVTNRKLPAIAYIDDRAIRFTSWDQAFSDLERFEPAR